MNYYLAEACCNTFVLYDRLETKELDLDFFEKVHLDLMKEDRDDALILIDGKLEGEVFHAQMIVFGRDKKLGEFCGNGARAAAAYLFDKYYSAEKGYLLTQTGKHGVKKHGNGVFSIALPPVVRKENRKFVNFSSQPHVAYFSEGLNKEYVLHYAEVLEPHLIFSGKLSDEELSFLGSELNNNEALFPLGINVNSCHWVEGHLFVKTFERGALRITRSCGTGSVCSAVI